MAGGNFDPSTQIFGRVGEANAGGSGASLPMRLDRNGATVVTGAHGYYCEASRNGRLFMAHAIVTAPVIYTTAAGTGGPLLWNGSNPGAGGVTANILAVGFGVTVVTTVAAALGITGATGQAVAPTATTAIDSSGNLLVGGPKSLCTAYRIGTPLSVGSFFLPFAGLDTGALTTNFGGVNWIVFDGMVTVAPNSWASVAASATASTTVASISMVWEEIPN